MGRGKDAKLVIGKEEMERERGTTEMGEMETASQGPAMLRCGDRDGETRRETAAQWQAGVTGGSQKWAFLPRESLQGTIGTM